MIVKIADVKKDKNGYLLTVKNVGGFAIPFDVQIVYADGEKATLHQTPALWQNNQQAQTVSINTNKTIQSITLDGGIFMDYTSGDNSWKS